MLELLTSQVDYLAFALAALGVIGVASYGLRRYRPGMKLPWLLWLLVLTVLLFGWFSTYKAGEHARQENIALISALAPTYAAELERMGHNRINEQTPPDDPLYLELIATQIRWQKLNPFAHDIYTFRKRADGQCILVVDSETDFDRNGDFRGPTERRTPIGKIYPQKVKGLEAAFRGETNFDSEIYTDEWGASVSAFVPMRDPTGKVEAVLGVDFDAQAWLQAIAKDRRGSMWITAFLLAIAFGGGAAIVLLRADIAERALAERRARESEQRLLLTIRQMPLGFIEWDVTARVLVWNPAAERIFGRPAAEVLGHQAFPLIVAPSAVQHVDKIWADLVQNTGGTHSVNENITREGNTIICEWFNTPLIGPDGKVVSVFSLFQDITQRVHLEKQLQRSERLSAIGQLSAGVAHDFNNILTIITGNLGMLLAPDQAETDLNTGLKSIEAAAIRAAGLTRQLLAFSRQQAMFPRVLDLGDSVKAITGMLARALTAAVDFKIEIAPDLPPVEADPAMLEQLVTNLVLNARDALPTSGGNVTVTVSLVRISPEAAAQNPSAKPGPAVCLSVADNGCGISAENVAHIFEPFFTTKPTGRGTGLGLSVVHGIVQQHHGWITVESTPGKGSTFRVFFPPTDRKMITPTADSPAAPAAPAKSRQTILLVEDEIQVARLARQILENAGYNVLSAADGPEALQVWAKERNHIDLLLTDMVMPNGLTGRNLSLQLLRDRPELPVIYASGYSIDLTAPDFCASDRMRFLPKPYLAADLIGAVRACLNRSI